MSSLINDIEVQANHFNELYPEMLGDIQSKYYGIDEFKSAITKSSRDIAVIHLNIRSLYAKLDDFMTSLGDLNCNFDFLGLTETWLTPSVHQLIRIPGYSMHSVMRE